MEVIPIDKPSIRIEDNGPYHISGNIKIKDDTGNVYETRGQVSLCRCGRSHEKPFCDGTHEEIGFESTPRAEDLMVEV
jgi:CDGSH-type Zn-finger protein